MRIVKIALFVHDAVCENFKKTAQNFHYEFNVRHITGVFQGLLGATPDVFQTPEKVFKMWAHESERIYGDRLVSAQHLKDYNKFTFEIIKKNSKHNLNK